MIRSNTLDAARRAFGGIVRGLIEKADDSKKLQTVNVRFLHNEQNPAVERFQTYGFTNVPLPPSGGKAAEVIALFLSGNRSHPAILSIDDRRNRPQNYKEGESSHYDDQGQYSKVARGGHHRVAKQHTMTAVGDDVEPGGLTKPDTTFELNEQLKGLSARVAQAEHNLHGLFDVTSQFRAIVQQQIPAVSAVAGILNQDPTGLKPMADAIADKEQAYLQKQVEQALTKFLSPNLAGLSSLLSGGLEASIGAMRAQIASLAGANPVVGTVDALTTQMSDLKASDAAASVISSGVAALQVQIDALTSANPIVGQIARLRNALQGLLDQAGPGLNFLAPQQRLVQGLSKSLHLAKS